MIRGVIGMALAVLLISCRREQEQATIEPPPMLDSSEPDSATTLAKAARDSAEFRLFLDSIALLARRLDSLGNDPSAGEVLFHLGRLKRRADRWMYYGAPGWNYSVALRGRGYYPDEANARNVYDGGDWKRLIELFPNDSLADDAAWQIAHHNVEGDCEDIPCALHRDVEPLVDFLTQFPSSSFDSAAVAEANAALSRILGRVADLRVADSSGDYWPAPVESLLVRYDAAALRLRPAVRASVQAVTGPLWVRLGKSAPR